MIALATPKRTFFNVFVVLIFAAFPCCHVIIGGTSEQCVCGRYMLLRVFVCCIFLARSRLQLNDRKWLSRAHGLGRKVSASVSGYGFGNSFRAVRWSPRPCVK